MEEDRLLPVAGLEAGRAIRKVGKFQVNMEEYRRAEGEAYGKLQETEGQGNESTTFTKFLRLMITLEQHTTTA